MARRLQYNDLASISKAVNELLAEAGAGN